MPNPISRCDIKEEPQTDGDQDEHFETMQHLKAYPPLPHSEIKEESELEEDCEECISNGEQLMTQQGRNWDQSNQEPTAQSGSAVWKSSEENGSEYDQDNNERSEHSSLEGLDESDNSSLSSDSTDVEEDFLPTLKAGTTKEPTRQVKKTSHRKKREDSSNHTAPNKRFKCVKCDRSYKQKRGLEQHTKNKCGVSFQCTLCKQNYSTKPTLRKHLFDVHNIARHELDQYGAGFKMRPMHLHKCEQCGRTYIQKGSLTRHLKSECGLEPSFDCPQCNGRFTQKSSLKLHLFEIHQVEASQLAEFGLGPVVRPENPFKCDRCGTSYKHRKTLKRHFAEKCGK